MRNKIIELSLNNKDIQFLISDVNKFSEELIRYYGFESIQQILDSVPIVTAQDVNQKRFLLKDKRFSLKSIYDFVQNLREEKLDSVLKSLDFVSTGSVKEVLPQEFEELVFNSEKESFIMFYKRDCDYCLRLDQTLEKLGLHSMPIF